MPRPKSQIISALFSKTYDFEVLKMGMSGPLGSVSFVLPSQECRAAFDFDADTDVDLSDFARFQAAFTD